MKLITWNIQSGRGVDGRVDLARIVAHARRLADFDVLCLQEVACAYPEVRGGDGADQFRQLAQLLPGFHAVSGIAVDAPAPGGGRRGFGNMILSRYPVGPVFRHLLPWPADSRVKSMQRIALEATLESPLGLLRIMTTHLEYYSPMQRFAQIERLRLLQQEGYAHACHPGTGAVSDGPFFQAPRGRSCILTGDFNALPDSEEIKRLVAPFDDMTPSFRDAWELAHPGQAHAPTVGLYDKVQWPGKPFTFDFIFVSADLAGKVRRLEADALSDASDHQPLSIELG